MNSTTPPELSGKALARSRLRARRRKARGIRRKVAAFSVAAFLAAWLGIYVQMVEGKDPALSTTVAHVSKQVTTSTQSTTSDDSTSSDDSSSSGASADSSSSNSSSSVSPSPVTTSQS